MSNEIQYPFADPAPFEIFDIVRKNKIHTVDEFDGEIYFRITDSADDTKYRVIQLSINDLHLHTMDKYTLINNSKNLLKPSENFSERALNQNLPVCVVDNRGKLRRNIGIFTTPIFGALRRFVAWGDQKYGSCDVSLSVVPRGLEDNTSINHSINHIDDTLSATEFYAKYAEEE